MKSYLVPVMPSIYNISLRVYVQSGAILSKLAKLVSCSQAVVQSLGMRLCQYQDFVFTL